MKNCNSIQPLLSAYLDKELGGIEMLGVRRHLNDCDGCREELETLICYRDILRQLPAVPELPVGLEDRLAVAIQAEKTPVGVRRPFLSVAVAAACITLICLPVLLADRQRAIEKREQDMARLEQSMSRDQVYAAGLDATSGSPVVSFSALSR